jgi:hypothetical protein
VDKALNKAKEVINAKCFKGKKNPITLEQALLLASNGFYLTVKNGRVINILGK